MTLLYPDGHPYGRRTKGTIDLVEAFTRDELLRLHAERFARRRCPRSSSATWT
jgi:predicted Zn-dependent peptidase